MTACEAHRAHQPRALTLELHHTVPVAWQLAYEPLDGADVHPGVDQAGRGALWDARTTVLCPTAHRNVHAILTDLVRGRPVRGGGRRERVIARQALERMLLATGVPRAVLLANHLYGNA